MYTYILIAIRWAMILHSSSPNVQNVLSNVGHRFGHQLGLDESSGRNYTTFLFGSAFRIYSMFVEISENANHH